MKPNKKLIFSTFLLISLIFVLFTSTASAISLVPILPVITLPDSAWDGTSDTVWNGSGTKANPYLITTAQELAGLAAKVNEGNLYQGKYFKLTADIRLVKDKLRFWTPIGNKNNMFRGSFDGDGHVVLGLYFSNKDADYVGLFGAIGTGGTVCNVGVAEGIIYADEKVGGIAGYSLGLIQNCYNTCSIPSYGDYVGGIVGYSGGSVIDCYNTGEILTKGSSPDYVGGVVGYARDGIVIGSYNTAQVRARYKSGGIIGAIGGSTLVLNCWNTGNIYTSSTRTGGIAGHSGSGCVVANCYNSGDVSADGKVGGIVGYSHGAVTINCYNTGYITSHGEDRPAAIVGFADDVAGSFEILGRGNTIKSSYVINCYSLTGSSSYAVWMDTSSFVSGMGRFASPDSNITRYEGTSSSGLFDSVIDLIDSLDKAFVDVIDTMFSIAGTETPESLKKLIDLNYHEPFSGNSTVYSGTLLDVLNAGVSGDSDSYGVWYQYKDTNGGYPVLQKKTDLVIAPIIPGTLRPIEQVILAPFEASAEAESIEDIAANSGDFILNTKYPLDKEINVGENAGFSTSLSSSNTYTGELEYEWYVNFENNEYLVEEYIEINGCKFTLENENLLNVKASLDAVPGVYQVYCYLSNYDTTLISRKASLIIHGAQVQDEPAYNFPFIDVADSAWYRNDVEIAHKKGMINGSTSTTYSPDNNMTIAEAVKLAACIHQLYFDDTITLTSGSPQWYSSYVTYALDNGIISSEYINYNTKITRREFVNIFYNSLPVSEYNEINMVTDGAIPDVPITAQYADKIYAFYRAGILVGSDVNGVFNSSSNIKRSEVAAILTRMFDESTRKSITLQ